MFTLPDLPYAYDALEPVISERTMRFHHDKHHAGYVTTLNRLLSEAGQTPPPLETVVRSALAANDKKLFNNAGQAWNHSFLWQAMTARPVSPTAALALAITDAFGGLEGLKAAFVAEGVGHFGSGWVWLVADRAQRLSIRTTHDADGPIAQADTTPLLVCDLWEHGYYLDYQNDRKRYLEAWFDTLPNWRFASSQYAAAQEGGEPWRHPAPGEPLNQAS
jgi:Fe-Mn family superoxide dismutase